MLAAVENSLEKRAAKGATSPEEKLRKQENANIDYMMRIHRRIDEIVDDPSTADALKPWYMLQLLFLLIKNGNIECMRPMSKEQQI